MANEPDTPAPFSLRRWSQRKHAAQRPVAPDRDAPAAVAPSAATPLAPVSGSATTATPAPVDAMPAATRPVVPSATPAPAATTPSAGAPAASIGLAGTAPVPPAANHHAAPAPGSAETPLPAVESLTLDSDFAQFLAPKVDEKVKQAALRKLFSDPHFNVMDGLDIYIDDYTLPDPMPAGMLDQLGKVYGALTDDGAGAARDVRVGAASAVPRPEAAHASPGTAADPRDDAARDRAIADAQGVQLPPATATAEVPPPAATPAVDAPAVSLAVNAPAATPTSDAAAARPAPAIAPDSP